MAKIITLFNHKGGVSKTTTTFNLAWMLAEKGKRVIMVDADPQCNLTGVTLGLLGPSDSDDQPVEDQAKQFEESQAKTEDFFTNRVDDTLYGALKPAFESQPVALSPVKCQEIEARPGLYLLPGHLQLGEYEVTLSVAHELSGSLLPLRNVPGAISHLLRITAAEIEADYVLVDLSPSLGSLNQNIVSTSDLLFVPTSPDFFSIMALRSLGGVIPKWIRWAEAASNNEVLKTANYPFLPPKLKLAGAIIQRYRLYRRPSAENPYGDPTGPFQVWINNVRNAMQGQFVPDLGSNNLLLPPETYRAADVGEDLVLGQVQEFNSLLPKSQDHRVPVFALTDEMLGHTGAVLEYDRVQIASLSQIFSKIADRLIKIADAV